MAKTGLYYQSPSAQGIPEYADTLTPAQLSVGYQPPEGMVITGVYYAGDTVDLLPTWTAAETDKDIGDRRTFTFRLHPGVLFPILASQVLLDGLTGPTSNITVFCNRNYQ